MTKREPISSGKDRTFSFKTPSSGESILVEDLLQDDEIRSRLQLIDEAILKYLEHNKGEPGELYDTAYHLINAGGKRLRSLLVLLACEAVEGDIDQVLPVAIATEFLQTASLIHDDIIDDDSVRRGVE